jgi:hypothetical protein
MATKAQRGESEPKAAEAKKTRNRRDEEWDERLRLVGDARFVEVEWSGRDHPYWPLPKEQAN